MSAVAPDRNLDDYLSLAIGVICAWLVPHVAIDIAEYRYEISRSPAWKGIERRTLGNHTIKSAALVAVSVAFVIFTASASLVALTTQDMDWRAQAIVTGLSRSKFAGLGRNIAVSISHIIPSLSSYWSRRYIFHIIQNSEMDRGVLV